MQSIIWEGYKTIEQTIEELLGVQDPILLSFDVFPLDYEVEDVFSPKIFLSQNRLVFFFDKKIEVYELKNLVFSVAGGKPNFTLIQQFFEFHPSFTAEKTPLSKNIDIPDDWVRISIKEEGFHAKEFVLRKNDTSLKGYQTWAFGQVLVNTQKDYYDYKVRRMVYGAFSFFDSSFLILAFLAFIVYVFILVVLGGILPGIIKSLFEWIFWLICIVVLLWQYWTIFVNLRRYRKIYEKYTRRLTV